MIIELKEDDHEKFQQYFRCESCVCGHSLYIIYVRIGVKGVEGQTVTIGTGTNTTNGTTSDPLERYYNYTHSQIVYTAAELTAAGMLPGSTINQIGFSISESGVALYNYTISMAHTAQATANPYISSGFTVVRTAFTYAPVVQTAGNFDMIALTTSFVWNGSSNLVVNICTGSNPYTSPYGGLRYTTTASNMT